MKRLLAALAALPAAAFAADAGLPPAQQELFDAERAFVRMAEEKGFRDSFYAYFADDGVAFNPHPFRVRVALAAAPPSPGPMGAAWAPVYGDISAAGDLGYRCVVVHDACATRDQEFEGIVVSCPRNTKGIGPLVGGTLMTPVRWGRPSNVPPACCACPPP